VRRKKTFVLPIGKKRFIPETAGFLREDTKAYLAKQYGMRYNEVNNRIEYGKFTVEGGSLVEQYEDLTDNKVNSMRLELLRNSIKISKDELKGLLNSDFVPAYNPFRSYFESLTYDDTRNYIQEVAATVKTTNDTLWAMYLERWLIGVVACAVDNNAINEHVLVIKGKQGMNKTTFIRNLVPQALASYYTEETINVNSKDAKIQMAECLIINMDEFDNIAGNTDGLKQLTTTKNLRIRRPYAAMHETMPRRTSFAATINAEQFLKDSTGNRRYLVVDATEISRDRFAALDQVYAQAYHQWVRGDRYYFTQEEIATVNEYNKQFELVYPEIEAIEQYLMPATDGDENAQALTATEITQFLCKKTMLPNSMRMVQKVGAALKGLGFKQRKSNGNHVYDVKMVGWE
jgi:predicted P-loop ATPase